MGCESSSISAEAAPKYSALQSILILDPSFSKPENQNNRDLLQRNKIYSEDYLTVDMLAEALSNQFTNNILVAAKLLPKLVQKLNELDLKPRLYVIGPEAEIGTEQKPTYEYLNFCPNFEAVLETAVKNKKLINPPSLDVNHQKVAILRRNKSAQQFAALEELLKARSISYSVHSCLNSLEQNLSQQPAFYLVTEYIFEDEVLRLVDPNAVRVICYCTLKQEIYGEGLYLITDNFLEIANEISSAQADLALPYISCSKIFVYSYGLEEIAHEIGLLFESKGLYVKLFNSLDSLPKYSTYFFAMTIVCETGATMLVEKRLHECNYRNRAKIIPIKAAELPQINTVSLRKELKLVREGYRVIKLPARSVDVIDKNHNTPKFLPMKQELNKLNLEVYGYGSAAEYAAKEINCSAYVICNFKDKEEIYDFISKHSDNSKLLVFCAKNKITEGLKKNTRYTLVDWHFGRISKYIKKHAVYYPNLQDPTEKRISGIIEKVKAKNHRISAQRWAVESSNTAATAANGETTMYNEFLNIDANTSRSQINDILQNSAQIWKLDYAPQSELQRFKQDLIESLKHLRKLYKLDIHNAIFETFVSSIKDMNLFQTAAETKKFFESSNLVGLKINQSLVKMDQMNKEQAIHLREIMFLLFLNTTTFQEEPVTHSIKLCHWTSSDFLERCETGSTIYLKKFEVFYEENPNPQDKIGNYKIQLELELDTLAEADPEYQNYFRHKNKYVFAPFSRFVLLDVIHPAFIKDLTIFRIRYEKDTVFTKAMLSSQSSIMNSLSNNMENIVDLHKFREKSGILKHIKAIQAYKTKDYATAKNFIKEAINDFECSDQPPSQNIMTEALLHLSKIAFAEGKMEEAVRALKDSVQNEAKGYLRKKMAQHFVELKQKIFISPDDQLNALENNANDSDSESDCEEVFKVLGETHMNKQRPSCLEVEDKEPGVTDRGNQFKENSPHIKEMKH